MMPSNNPTALSAVVGGPGAPRTTAPSIATLAAHLVMPVLLAAFASYLLVGILTMSVPEGAAFPGPQFFPGLISAGLYLLAILLGLSGFRQWQSSRTQTDDAAADSAGGILSRPRWRSLLWVVGSFLAFALLLEVLGWIIAATVLFVGVVRGFASSRWLFNALVGLTLSSVIYIAFDMLLGLSLPSGILGGGL